MYSRLLCRDRGNSRRIVRNIGERGRIRTCDPCLKRALLYHLSYAPNILEFNTIEITYIVGGAERIVDLGGRDGGDTLIPVMISADSSNPNLTARNGVQPPGAGRRIAAGDDE